MIQTNSRTIGRDAGGTESPHCVLASLRSCVHSLDLVELVRPIPTHCLTYRAGLRFRAEWLGDELANLFDDRGILRVSCARSETFRNIAAGADHTKARRHEGGRECRPENSASSAEFGSGLSSQLKDSNRPAETARPGSRPVEAESSASVDNAERRSNLDSLNTHRSSASRADFSSIDSRVRVSTRSLEPCECGFFTSGSRQCKGCGAILEGDFRQDEQDQRDGSVNPVYPAILSNSDSLIDQVNAELMQGGRSTLNHQPSTVPEACPFEPTGVVAPRPLRQIVKWDQPERFYRAEVLAEYSACWVRETREQLRAVGWKFTTETRSHGEEDCGRDLSVVSNGNEKDQQEGTTETLACVENVGTSALQLIQVSRRSESAEGRELPSESPSQGLSVTLCLRGESVRVYGPGEFPEISEALSRDERTGWIRSRDHDGRIVWRFGPGGQEFESAWREWLTRLQAFNAAK